MLPQNKEMFFQIIRDFIGGVPSEIPEGTDVSETAALFERHDMGGIFVHQLSPVLRQAPEYAPLYKAMYQKYIACISLYQKRQALLGKINEAFQSEAVPYIIFKGTEVAELYPHPELRTMGDSDILVHPEDKQKAHRAMLELGFTNTDSGPNEWVYYLGNLEFELHHRLMNDEASNYDSHKAFLNRPWEYAAAEPDTVRHRLDWSYHLIYLLLHLRKHFINSGVGFRQFLDIAVILSKCSLDWDWIQKELKQMELTDFAATCFGFCERWFGVSAPMAVKEIPEEFYGQTTRIIFANGVFGKDNKENADNYAIFQMRQKNETGKDHAFRRMLALTFPSYRDLSGSEKYAFLNGRPWLLPAAWVYRFAQSFAAKRHKTLMKAAVSSAKISEDAMQERSDFLTKWGL